MMRSLDPGSGTVAGWAFWPLCFTLLLLPVTGPWAFGLLLLLFLAV